MIANALFAATVLMLALFFFLGHELRFLIPYRFLLVHQYGSAILISAAVLFVNLAAALFTLGRRFFLKDTGRKLAHLDRELNAGRTPLPRHLYHEEFD
jgi:hypothetical protein